MPDKPKTFKLVIPGEIIRQINTFTFPDGRTVKIPVSEKIVVPSKKNQQKIAINKATLQPILLPSAQYEKWHKQHLGAFKRAVDRMAVQGYSLPITRAKIKVLFYFPDSKDRDLSNKFETIADIMVDAGILMDDKFKVLKPIYLDGWVQRQWPRTEVYLTILTPKEKDYEWDATPASYYEDRKARERQLRQIRDARKREQRLAAKEALANAAIEADPPPEQAEPAPLQS